MKSLNLTKPHLIMVVGIPGAGKSYFAKQFSDTFSAPLLDIEEIRSFVSDEKSIAKLWDFTLDKLIRTKQTMMIEGFGATKAERRKLSAFARSHGYQPLFVWVQTEPATAQLRATKGIGKNKPKYPLSDGEFKEKLQKFESLIATEPYMVISGKHTYASQAKNVLKKLAEPRAEKAKTPTIEKRSVLEQPDAPVAVRRGRITIN